MGKEEKKKFIDFEDLFKWKKQKGLKKDTSEIVITTNKEIVVKKLNQ